MIRRRGIPPLLNLRFRYAKARCMKFTLTGRLKESVYNLMRQIGYAFQGKDEETGELGFARPPRGYPRFHLFIKVQDENLTFSLHLDQKRPIYRGVSAHAGEYDNELIKKEAERIKQLF